MDPCVGHLNGILARVGGNLNNNFQKSQMPGGLPGGGMLKLRFDRYIIDNRLGCLLVIFCRLGERYTCCFLRDNITPCSVSHSQVMFCLFTS